MPAAPSPFARVVRRAVRAVVELRDDARLAAGTAAAVRGLSAAAGAADVRRDAPRAARRPSSDLRDPPEGTGPVGATGGAGGAALGHVSSPSGRAIPGAVPAGLRGPATTVRRRRAQ